MKYWINLLVLFLMGSITGCSSTPESSGRNPSSVRAVDIDYYSACMRERDETYCRKVTGKYDRD
ncbi:MAG: hypothetical protein KDD25_05905 [Bdellovibrionales bacterium]|nr:hypothetical protein [Bdellovibrionales bacterium]